MDTITTTERPSPFGQPLIANSMWLLWGLLFSPLRWLGIVHLTHHQPDHTHLTAPVIIAANHRHPVDPLTIGIALFPALTRKLLPLAPYAAPLHRLQRPGQRIARYIGFLPLVYFVFNVVRIPESVSFHEKLAPLLAALKAKESVLIFPEGRSYTTPTTQPFKPGVGALHLYSQASVIPCALHYHKQGWRRWVVVAIGAPFHVAHTDTSTDVETVAEHIRQAVEEQYQIASEGVY
jgi:1-acyl-sn-glycerol-3-phosphate acyltransferase